MNIDTAVNSIPISVVVSVAFAFIALIVAWVRGRRLRKQQAKSLTLAARLHEMEAMLESEREAKAELVRQRRDMPRDTPLEEADRLKMILTEIAETVRTMGIESGIEQLASHIETRIGNLTERMDQIVKRSNERLSDIESRVKDVAKVMPEKQKPAVASYSFDSENVAVAWRDAHERGVWLGFKGYEFTMVIDDNDSQATYRFSEPADAAEFRKMFG